MDHLPVLEPGDAGRRCALGLAAEAGRTGSGSRLTLRLLQQSRRNCKKMSENEENAKIFIVKVIVLSENANIVIVIVIVLDVNANIVKVIVLGANAYIVIVKVTRSVTLMITMFAFTPRTITLTNMVIVIVIVLGVNVNIDIVIVIVLDVKVLQKGL